LKLVQFLSLLDSAWLVATSRPTVLNPSIGSGLGSRNCRMAATLSNL